MSSKQPQQPPRPERPGPIKLTLRSPTKPALCTSYTVTPASITEVTVRIPPIIRAPVEISSAAVAQPFVDPVVLERRNRSSGS
ncbi:hypothetical protein F5B20DRAFT_38449 [Whalleya microplaca]|nr:hypothetical protein F5B20DRAFT_38449 [Whalleya microplaca]